MPTEDRGPDRLEAGASGARKARSQAGGKMLRFAEAIADGNPVEWEEEIRDVRGGEFPWPGLRILEAIATYHSPAARVPVAHGVSKTPLLPPVAQDPQSESLFDSWGSLILRERLGKGGCASVFRAYDPALEREVALKLPHQRDSSFSRLFLAEARRLARIRHENVVAVHGAEELDGQVGMWMDLVEGQNLEECVSAQGPFSAKEATLIGIDICRALAAVHHAGLVHRDVKAANVMREAGGRIVLMDFSSVVETKRGIESSSDATTHGTHIYMAPELLDGEEATTASDIYSLGVLLYRLVSGRYPIEARSLEELRRKHRSQGADSLLDVRPDLPIGFVQVIERALSTDPKERYATAGEMEQALVGVTQGVQLPKPLPWLPGVFRDRRLWAGVAALMLIAVTLVVGILALLPKPLTVEAYLYRTGAELDDRLLPGDQLSLGDRLYMTVKGSRPMHVYVLNEDARGRRYRLFPLETLALENPLTAGVEHWLPGSAKSTDESGEGSNGRYWEVTSVGGEETLMLIASTEDLARFEERIAAIPAAGEDSELEGWEFRGVSGIVAGSKAKSKPSLDELRRELEETHGENLTIWQIRLTNPPFDSGG